MGFYLNKDIVLLIAVRCRVSNIKYRIHAFIMIK